MSSSMENIQHNLQPETLARIITIGWLKKIKKRNKAHYQAHIDTIFRFFLQKKEKHHCHHRTRTNSQLLPALTNW